METPTEALKTLKEEMTKEYKNRAGLSREYYTRFVDTGIKEYRFKAKLFEYQRAVLKEATIALDLSPWETTKEINHRD